MERVSEWDAPPNLSDDCSPHPARFSDADAGDSSPASSNYSSCDGSDFDRYCSANSVLGSASICSSVGEDFSLEGHSSREKFMRSRWGGYDCSSDGGAETSRAKGSSESPLARVRTSSRLIHCTKEILSSRSGMHDEDNAEELLSPFFSNGQGLRAFSDVYSSSQGAGGDGETSDEKGTLAENSGNRLNGIHIGSGITLEANDDVFSQCQHSDSGEHSDSEDSMLDYVTDNEDRIHLFEKRSSRLVEEAKHEDVNQLLINSSVAFGSTDWDEFEQDMAGGGLDSVPLYLDQSFQQQVKHIGTEFLKEVEDTAVVSYEAENLPIHEVGDGNYVSKTSYEEQVIKIPTRDFGDNKYSVKKNHEEDVIDPPIKDSEYVNAPVSGSTLSEDNAPKCYLNSLFVGVGRKIQSSHGKEEFGKSFHEASETNVEDESEAPVYPLSYEHSCSHPMCNIGDGSSIQRVEGKDSSSTKLSEMDTLEKEVKKLDTYDSYDEMVLEMEQILLDSGKEHGYMYIQDNQGYMSQQTNHFRDGSSIGSSGTDDMCPPVHVSSKIDRVEVVGAKQKKGDVSLGERLVGVREYTIYRIKVWSSTDEWEVERRYRDFFALYRQLKALFTGHGLTLPTAWSNVEQDSRKIFGNASPNVVMERSALIEDCLRSILNSGYSFGIPSPLTRFLTPGKAMYKSGLLHSLVPQYLQKFSEDENSNYRVARSDGAPVLGKTISLVVEIKPHKSLRQLLEMQHYTCAGCHRHLDAGKTLFRELVQTFGWNRPRFCEYTGQLFCASCHTNDTSVLPARVLHHWDFSLYPVSQLAKAYLESIFDQPMLCVSAVNPFLFSKVPALLHVMDFRRKIGAMLPYVNCPYRSSIQKTLGFRRHLLEGNDFFTLRDLVDLSKGPFAALPMMVENILNLILEHITQQCLICYDSGAPCAARQACHDPSSLIFPFQEAEAEKCSSCGSIFHKACYVNLLGCPCSKTTTISKRFGSTEPSMVGSHREPVGFLERSIQPFVSKSSTGFLTNILSRARSDKTWKTKNSSPVILMGSLPSSSL